MIMKQHTEKFLKDYRPAPYLIDSIDLLMEIHAEKTIVTSNLRVRRNPDIPEDNAPFQLDMGPYKIRSVVADGMMLLDHEYQADERYFSLARTPDQFHLEITNELDPAQNTSLEGLYKSGEILCTQCEAEGFRRITPFPDRPDVMTLFTCTITADKTRYPVLLSNGNLVASGDLDDNRHYAKWEDPHKKPSYLFAMVAGDLASISDEFTTRSGRRVALKILSEKENIDKCEHAMESLKQSMAWDEERFGLEYDLDLYQIVAINDFNAGAMENKGLNIFNAKYVLANPQTATDDDFMGIQAVIGHEYFHNWTGNRVTLKNWFQLSLKEGLTVFRDQEFSSDLNSRTVNRIANVKLLKAHQFPEDQGPMTHPVRPESYIKMDNFYTMTVYEKGAELVRMIHSMLGESDFQKGMTLYFERFDGMAVTTEDFLEVMQTASGVDLSHFKTWYSQSGTPVLTLKRRYDPQSQTLELTFNQSTPTDRNQAKKESLPIPIAMGLIDPEGKDITPPGAELFILDQASQTLSFNNIPQGTIPSVLRDFSAPVLLETDLTPRELAHLMAYDTNDFNRWDAAQTLYKNEIQNLVTTFQSQKAPSLSDELVQAFRTALTQKESDRAFLAKALAVPKETEIKEYFQAIDVDAIHQARQFLKIELARALKNELLAVLESCRTADPQQITAENIGKRALKNQVLSLLASLKTDDIREMVQTEFETARNMTEEFGALAILAQMDETAKARAVEQFYQKWSTDTLVLDKWFAVQATSPLPDTLDRITELLEHPAFSMKNPNKVRSLINMFAMQNPRHFHKIDGSGYAWVEKALIELDAINPQITARLASCFNQWKKYDAVRKDLMEQTLKRILNHDGLSENVYEIVSRALE